jgi:hypothetical protein
VAVVLGCLGLCLANPLLIATQALAALMAGLLWGTDVAARLLTGKHLFGGTEYMWDARVPLAVRLMSLFHLLLPVVLVAALRRTGYQRRALAVQVALTVPLVLISRVLASGKNLNYAFADPVLHKQWGPVPVHLFAVVVGISVIVYWPAHLAFSRWLPPPVVPGRTSNVGRS